MYDLDLTLESAVVFFYGEYWK